MTASEWRLLGEAWALSVAVGYGLRWVPFERLVRSAAARAGRATCLTRALVLKRLLLRRGVETELVIGAKRGAGVFEAHAWLCLGDEILLGGERHSEFAPLWSRAPATVGVPR